jgi:hypothetical protein
MSRRSVLIHRARHVQTPGPAGSRDSLRARTGNIDSAETDIKDSVALLSRPVQLIPRACRAPLHNIARTREPLPSGSQMAFVHNAYVPGQTRKAGSFEVAGWPLGAVAWASRCVPLAGNTMAPSANLKDTGPRSLHSMHLPLVEIVSKRNLGSASAVNTDLKWWNRSRSATLAKTGARHRRLKRQLGHHKPERTGASGSRHASRVRLSGTPRAAHTGPEILAGVGDPETEPRR